MPVLHVRTDVCPHHKRNVHVKINTDGTSVPYIEFSHIGVLATQVTVEDVIAFDITEKGEDYTPEYTEVQLKELIKDVLLEWGTQGVKKWEDSWNSVEVKEVLEKARNAAMETVPEIYGLERKPKAPKEKKVEVKRNVGDDYTAMDLMDMSRKQLIEELKFREIDVPEDASSNFCRKELMKLIEPAKV